MIIYTAILVSLVALIYYGNIMDIKFINIDRIFNYNELAILYAIMIYFLIIAILTVINIFFIIGFSDAKNLILFTLNLLLCLLSLFFVYTAMEEIFAYYKERKESFISRLKY